MSAPLWTAEEDRRALALYRDGRPIAAIAAALGRAYAATRTRLVVLRRRTHSPIRRDAAWREHEDAIRRLAGEGRSDDAIADALGGGITVDMIRTARQRFGIPAALRPGETAARRGTTQRACLCCRKPFPSEGAHNRLCTPCKASAVFAA